MDSPLLAGSRRLMRNMAGRLARAKGYPRLMVLGYGCLDAPPAEARPGEGAFILRAIAAQSPPVQYICHRGQLPGLASLHAWRAGPYGTSSQVQLPGFRYRAEVPWDPSAMEATGACQGQSLLFGRLCGSRQRRYRPSGRSGLRAGNHPVSRCTRSPRQGRAFHPCTRSGHRVLRTTDYKGETWSGSRR